MSRLLPILLHERFRRYKKFFVEKPFLAVGLLSSIVYVTVGVLTSPFCVSEFLDNPVVIYAVMVYLIAKIINPTQGMILDYQLLELKLISLTEYKFLLSKKLFGGSIILSLICLPSYTKMTALIGALNVVVNVWVFLRNRWNNRIYDLLIAVIVVFSIKFQATYLSLLGMILMIGIYIAVKRVNYGSILSLYKLIYKIGQQRYHGVVYSEAESRDIQKGAETLIGKAREKNANWCENLYDKTNRFLFYKEVARIIANSNKIIINFIICIVISMGGLYIPRGYRMLVFILLAMIAQSFDMTMNRLEAKLLLRGFIDQYVVADIVKNKIFVYTIVNFIFLVSSVMFGRRWLLLALICSFLIALVSLVQCFRIKSK